MTHWSPESTAPQRPPLSRAANSKVAGVAAGLGQHLRIDANIIRVLFVALAIFGGSGFLLYVGAWLLMPGPTVGAGTAGATSSPTRSTPSLVAGGVLLGFAVLLALFTIADFQGIPFGILLLLFTGLALLNRRPDGWAQTGTSNAGSTAATGDGTGSGFVPMAAPLQDTVIDDPFGADGFPAPPTAQQPWPPPSAAGSGIPDSDPDPTAPSPSPITAPGPVEAPEPDGAEADLGPGTGQDPTTEMGGTTGQDPTTNQDPTTDQGSTTSKGSTTEMGRAGGPPNGLDLVDHDLFDYDLLDGDLPGSGPAIPDIDATPDLPLDLAPTTALAGFAADPLAPVGPRPHWAVPHTAGETSLATRQPRPPGPPLASITMAAILAAVGIALVMNTVAGIFVRTATVTGVGLVIVGMAIAITAYRGRTLPLLPIAAVLSLVLPISPIIDHAIADGTGSRSYFVDSPDVLNTRYGLGVGDLTLDLRGLELTEDTEVDVAVGTGALEILLGRDIVAEVHAEVDIGYAEVLGHGRGGIRPELHVVPPSSADPTAPRLIIRSSTDIGSIDVYRN